jgi:hypothetical protein
MTDSSDPQASLNLHESEFDSSTSSHAHDPMMDGIPLARQSSFERFIHNLEVQQKELSVGSAQKIQHFWRMIIELRQQQKVIQRLQNDDILAVSAMLSTVNTTKSFHECQELVMDGNFIQALQATIQRLYPKSSKPPRDARLAASAILIHHYPMDILQDSETPPSSPTNSSQSGQTPKALDEEVINCITAAKLTVITLKRLLGTIAMANKPPMNATVAAYRRAHRAYHASFLYFMKSLDLWKKYDKSRIAQQLELSFVQSYSLWISARQLLTSAASGSSADLLLEEEDEGSPKSPSKLQRNAENQLQKIKSAYRSIVGINAAEARFEELSAMVEASLLQQQQVADPSLMNLPPKTETTAISLTSAADAAVPLIATDIELPAEQQVLLSKLLQSGLEEEKLIYEVIYDPSFQLPSIPSLPSSIEPTAETSADLSTALAMKFRMRMMFLMNDRMVWSLKTSPISNPNQDLAVGLIIPIAVPTSPTTIVYESARITSINRDASETTIDVQYLSDSSYERNIPLTRLKYASQAKDPSMFLSSLQDLIRRVSSLTPNRKDLQDRLIESFDMELLNQMIVHNAMNVEDCLKLFYHLFVSILRLQAPVRSELSKRWWKQFIEDAKKCNSFQDFVDFIPQFFTYTAQMIDEILRDVSLTVTGMIRSLV